MDKLIRDIINYIYYFILHVSKLVNGENDTTGGNSDIGGNVDPLFISSSDNPTSSLVTAVFFGNNFMCWSRNVRRALIAKNKEGFINGTLKMPGEKDNSFQNWKRADTTRKCYINDGWTTTASKTDGIRVNNDCFKPMAPTDGF